MLLKLKKHKQPQELNSKEKWFGAKHQQNVKRHRYCSTSQFLPRLCFTLKRTHFSLVFPLFELKFSFIQRFSKPQSPNKGFRFLQLRTLPLKWLNFLSKLLKFKFIQTYLCAALFLCQNVYRPHDNIWDESGRMFDAFH